MKIISTYKFEFIRVACFYWLCHQISQRRPILTRFSNKEQSIYFRKQALQNVFQNQSLSVDCVNRNKNKFSHYRSTVFIS